MDRRSFFEWLSAAYAWFFVPPIDPLETGIRKEIQEGAKEVYSLGVRLIQWIPLSERPPERIEPYNHSKEVLLANDDGGILMGMLIWHDGKELCEEFGNPHWSVGDEGFRYKLDSFTHWAYLPASPEKEM